MADTAVPADPVIKITGNAQIAMALSGVLA